VQVKNKDILFHPIGYVKNEFDLPAAPETIRSSEATIILNPDLTEGLLGLEAGQQVMVIFNFHLSEGFTLLQHPRGDVTRSQRGVFALRSPNRPNPIGVSIADILKVEGNKLQVRGLDAINGTPVIDLKPA
jgi:tRNA-Thr(GGU) m(6)t(6)A37 methyltransferase TsaA